MLLRYVVVVVVFDFAKIKDEQKIEKKKQKTKSHFLKVDVCERRATQERETTSKRERG